MKIKNLIILSMIILFLILLKINYDKIPSRINHINRNQYNQFPIGKLSLIKDDEFIDESGILWVKRGFLNSILHNPFKYYIFETYDKTKISSSEVEILKRDFDEGNQNFSPSSFNYYSSFNYPISHFFADILPIVMYLRPKYKIYKRV
jgi:hypothetical protein